MASLDIRLARSVEDFNFSNCVFPYRAVAIQEWIEVKTDYIAACSSRRLPVFFDQPCQLFAQYGRLELQWIVINMQFARVKLGIVRLIRKLIPIPVIELLYKDLA